MCDEWKKIASIILKIRQYGKRLRNRTLSNIFWFENHRETFILCKANPITKCFINRCEVKGKPDRTSIRYGMKLYHHDTCNRYGMSTHLRRVRTDPNLPICTMSVCAVYVPLPWSHCRLHILIRTRTALCSSR